LAHLGELISPESIYYLNMFILKIVFCLFIILFTSHCVSSRAEKNFFNQLIFYMKLNVQNPIVVIGEFRDPVDKIARLSGH